MIVKKALHTEQFVKNVTKIIILAIWYTLVNKTSDDELNDRIISQLKILNPSPPPPIVSQSKLGLKLSSDVMANVMFSESFA